MPRTNLREVLEHLATQGPGLTAEKDAVTLLDLHLGRVQGCQPTDALAQLIDAHWGDVDTLLVDLPPGTGDVQLTMLQRYKPMGAVLVSTPQDLALIDAARAGQLFDQAGVPVIGLVENMAGYACPHCGEVSDPFGRGGAEAAAQEEGRAEGRYVVRASLHQSRWRSA